MTDDSKCIDLFLWRAVSVLFLRYAVLQGTGWVLIWGVVALGLRAAFNIQRSHLLWWGLSGFAPVLLLSAILSVLRAPTREAVCVLLDRWNKCGGMLMSREEAGMSAWGGRLPRISVPRLYWRARRAFCSLLAVCLFAAGAYLVPWRYTAAAFHRPVAVRNTIEELKEDAYLLQEEEILLEERVAEINAQLERVWEESSSDNQMKSWEALDHLRNSLCDTAGEAAEKMLAGMEELAAVEALAEALDDQASSGTGGKDLTEAMRELASMMQDKELQALLEDVKAFDLKSAVESLSLTPDQLAELAETLRNCQGRQLDKMRKLCEARLVDTEMLSQCQRSAEGEDALAAFLRENSDGCLAKVACRIGLGNGGVNRGRGDAPMTWGNGSDESEASFREEMLSPSAISDVERSRLVGITVGKPGDADGTVRVVPGALNGAAHGGGAAPRHKVLPMHRQAVREFFGRKAE